MVANLHEKLSGLDKKAQFIDYPNFPTMQNRNQV